ncbi:MAG: hypothetical protein EXR98_03110 [Gemmataceae bacterium]|nr:hypothetical protein [Gemmataceae bacterium]
MDRRTLALLDALKLGAMERGEVRLYRRGKLPGMFGQRTRLNADIADQAVKDGLLEMARVETVGKVAVEWVRVTQKGLAFLVDNESPVRALTELSEALALNQQGLPSWAAQMHARIEQLATNFDAEVGAMRNRLEQLSQRVVAAIERLESAWVVPDLPATPWAGATIDYLERRRQVGLGTRCPLADLFSAVREKHAELTIKDFHAGLRRMQETKAITLLPSTGNGDTPGAEYAMLDGTAVYYYVSARTTV